MDEEEIECGECGCYDIDEDGYCMECDAFVVDRDAADIEHRLVAWLLSGEC